jgi:hypothetical protein
VRPTVLIVGGFMTVPANYWPLRRRLLRRGAGDVRIAPIWPIDWALAAVLGLGPIMRRTRKAILRAYHSAGDQPTIVVAHSGGGIAARLAMSATPFHGRPGGAAEAVGCLVTLGTPHQLAGLASRYRHAGHEACAFLDRESPGASFAPRTAYLSVGSRYPMAGLPGIFGQAVRGAFSVIIGGEAQADGDGIVPLSAVHLAGAEQMTYDDARHGHIGANWYGSDAIVDRWWPAAVRLWRAALEERAAGGTEAARSDAPPRFIAPSDEPSGGGLVAARKGSTNGSAKGAPH